MSEGPLAFPSDAGNSWVSMGVRPGQFGVVGIPLEYRRRSGPAVLVAVHPEHPAQATCAHLRFAATSGSQIGGARGWKPTAWRLRPVRGFMVSHGKGTTTVIVGVAAAKGAFFIRSFAIDYRIGQTRYRAVYPVGIKICVGTSLSCS
ncbi:MAG TPA: hypothetical protein VI142_04670 [Gaiellaceae bacterium]